MTKLEHDAWLAVADALDSIDGFAGGPDQVQAIGNAMSAICDLLDDKPNSKGILDSSPNQFPPEGFPCEVWVYPNSKCLSYSAGRGKFREIVGHDPHNRWPHWRPAGLPADAKPGVTFVYHYDGEVVRHRSRESWMDSPNFKARYIYTVPGEDTNE